jgi:hypothetical protein
MLTVLSDVIESIKPMVRQDSLEISYENIRHGLLFSLETYQIGDGWIGVLHILSASILVSSFVSTFSGSNSL